MVCGRDEKIFNKNHDVNKKKKHICIYFNFQSVLFKNQVQKKNKKTKGNIVSKYK